MYWNDPQDEAGHYCAICGREIFGDDILCQRCLDRAAEEDM